MDIAYYSDALIMFQEALDLVVDVYGTGNPLIRVGDLGKFIFYWGLFYGDVIISRIAGA